MSDLREHAAEMLHAAVNVKEAGFKAMNIDPSDLIELLEFYIDGQMKPVGSELPDPHRNYVVIVDGEYSPAIAYTAKRSDGVLEWVFTASQLDGCEHLITHYAPIPGGNES